MVRLKGHFRATILGIPAMTLSHPGNSPESLETHPEQTRNQPGFAGLVPSGFGFILGWIQVVPGWLRDGSGSWPEGPA